MSKRLSRILSFVIALTLFIVPMTVLADGDPNILYGTVFNDTNQDGLFDEGLEPGIDGVTIELYVTGDTTPSETTTTSGGGLYSFEIVTDGFYTVKVSEFAGTVDSTPDSVDFEVDSATPLDVINFGKVLIDDLGSISGTVYDDLDRSGDVSAGDEGIELVELRLLDGEGFELATTQTDSYGDYIFEDLLARDYTVVETDPPLYYSITSNQLLVTLGVNEDMVGVDFFDFIPNEGEVPKIDFLLMKYFDIALLDLQSLREMDGWGYGNIAKAYFIAQLGDTALGEILGMRETMGWGEIMKDVLGYAGLKGYNLGLIVSGRDTPQVVLNLINGCDLIDSAEQVQQLFAMGASNGAIKKACKLAQEVGGDYDKLVLALDLLKDHNQKQVREVLQDGATIQAENTEGNGDHGPPACKGKNKNDPGCNN